MEIKGKSNSPSHTYDIIFHLQAEYQTRKQAYIEWMKKKLRNTFHNLSEQMIQTLGQGKQMQTFLKTNGSSL